MLFEYDATYYAEKIRNKTYTCLELVEAALNNILELNPKLNAVVHVQAKQALQKAEKMDKFIQTLDKNELETLPSFYGVPILLKDLGQQQKGEPSTNGSNLLKDNISKQSDAFVERIQQAGFIIVGRTNIPEFGFKTITDSKMYQPANSPLDLTRNPGGSSGGAASALKAGIVPVVTASDGGGSIRIPASFTGLIGLKPSRGRIVVGPNRYRGWQGAATDFFLTKSVRDTWELLKITQEEQYDAPFTLPLISEQKLKLPETSFNIAYTHTPLIDCEVSKEVHLYLNKAVSILKFLNHKLIEDTMPIDREKLVKSYYTVNSVETAVMIQAIESNLGRKIQPNEIESMSWAIYQAGIDVKATDYSKLLAEWDQWSSKAEHFFNTYDLYMTPVAMGGAPKQDQFDKPIELEMRQSQAHLLTQEGKESLVEETFNYTGSYAPYAMQVNILGQAAISLPILKTSEGLPFGIQFVASKGKEYKLLQLAKQLEDSGLLYTEIVKV